MYNFESALQDFAGCQDILQLGTQYLDIKHAKFNGKTPSYTYVHI